MKSTIDRAGRIVVPKAIREAAHLRPGTVVRFRVQGGHVEIEPVPLTVTLQRRLPGGRGTRVGTAGLEGFAGRGNDRRSPRRIGRAGNCRVTRLPACPHRIACVTEQGATDIEITDYH
jgi:AbrB family looped-hinge helix DNA binding protein